MAKEALTGKAKKAKRSEERHKQSKKRKRDEDTEENQAASGEKQQVSTEAAAAAPKKQKTGKKLKKDRTATKEKKEKRENKYIRAKKEREERRNRKRRSAEAGFLDDKAKTPKVQTPAAAEDTVATEGVSEEQPSGKQRFIVFIGNLPYSTTTAALEKHFASISPSSIRPMTDRRTGKNRGSAFLEFASYDRMKTCLKLFHHSSFDSGVPGEAPRKINVELSAGGGGKSESRMEKIKGKNVKLDEERKRRAAAAAKQESRKAKKAKGGDKGTDSANEAEEAKQDETQGGMHPSRLARLQGH